MGCLPFKGKQYRSKLPQSEQHALARKGVCPFVERMAGVTLDGFIDGHAVVYNKSGFILDIAAVF